MFNRYPDELQAFQLEGDRYRRIELTEPRWIPTLKLGLGLWLGEYRGKNQQWLRWYDGQGNWILTEAQKERREKELAQEASRTVSRASATSRD